ncbi:hypothetical protein FYK55_22835 [Roseiconus nitratireducens]|uniref:Uncharacterized protein n=1 Tax=Roseiconus nitratireducens TaxID=2605748 RepID=A0A5M6CXD4_9BACT|nr:hypothetical protein [Roseiconus nitratireducens]KAA5539887.1 hypothetical protein FYK55_22835 [Roseiconus nitratireducens]
MKDSVLLTDDNPVDPDDELLVAYLDDELKESERVTVEQRLINEESLRRRLQSLQTGWEWLDELPGETPNEKLVESTIELVVSDIAPAAPQTTSWWARHHRGIALTLLSLLSLLVGAAGMAMSRHAMLRSELSDLEVAEDLDAYLVGADFDFLRELAANPQWIAMLEAMEDVYGQSISPESSMQPIPVSRRDEFIVSLSSEQRDRLESRWYTFQRLSEEKQQAVRDVAKQVADQPDHDQLLKTMKAFSVWRENLDDDVKDQLDSDDPKVARSAAQQAISETMEDLARRSGTSISEETAERLFFRLRQLLELRVESNPELAESMERSRRGVFGDRTEGIYLRMMVDGRDSRGRPGFFRPPPSGPGSSSSDSSDERSWYPAEITEQELHELTLLLSDEAMEKLNALTNLQTPFARDAAVVMTMRAWAQEAIRREAPMFDADQRSDLDRYLELNNRDEVDLLPPDEILRRVAPEDRWGNRFRRR